MLHNESPRLMALLLDLPPAVKGELARRWGVEEDAAAIYRAMTEPGALAARVAALGPAAAQVLAALRRAPASRRELLARLPVSEVRLDAALAALAEHALVLRLPEAGGRTPRLATAANPADRLYVPADVAAALASSRQ